MRSPIVMVSMLVIFTSFNTLAQDIPFGHASQETFHQIEQINNRYDMAKDLGGLAASYGLVITDPGVDGEVQAATTDADSYTTAAEFIRGLDVMRRDETRTAIQTLLNNNDLEDHSLLTDEERQFWEDLERSIDVSGRRSGSTGGDPHIATLDGYFYDLQTVGEFVLCKSTTRKFEVQVRQKAWSGNLAVNTAVAMNLHGAKISFYASDHPDNQTSDPLRIDGRPYTMKKKFVRLKKGGAIQKINDHYFFVLWETGEKVAVTISEYLDIVVTVPRFKKTEETGLMGNNNGNKEDDLKTSDNQAIKAKSWAKETMQYINLGKINQEFGSSEKAFNESISKKFADSWRITGPTSLFTYAPHKSSDSFSDKAFPASYNSVSDLTADQVSKAKKTCKDAGVADEQLQGCIYDVAFTNRDIFAKTTAFLAKTKNTLQEANSIFTTLDKVDHLNTTTNKVKQKIKKKLPHF